MFKCEKARRGLLVDNAKLNMAALLVLAVFCLVLLGGEKDCAGTHAWESICLAFCAVPAWCVAFLYRPYSFVKRGRDALVFGLVLGYEAVLICWHAPLLWGVHDWWYWHTGVMHPRWAETSMVWGWLPVHACMLAFALVGIWTLYRLKKNNL